MKKTATITFHASNNNGAFLQAYALQKFLTEKLNIHNEIIDIRSKTTREANQIFKPIKGVADIAKSIVSVLRYIELKKRKNKFENLRNTYLNTTTPILTEADATLKMNEYDYVIAGSDQIWNTRMPGGMKAYFLTDVKSSKISYGVSCGSNIKLENLLMFEKSINEFDAVSVREKETADVIRQIYINGEVRKVLDPTFLIKDSEYNDLYDLENAIVKKPYLFFYSINYQKDILEAAKKISDVLKMPVVTVFTGHKTVVCHKYGFKVIYSAGPGEFLNLIKNADSVLTNSFHGAAFSVIFRKNFYYLKRTFNGMVVRDDRIDGLLETLKLSEHSITSLSTSEEILSKRYVDYTMIEDVLRKKTDESIEFLKQALN